MTAYRRLPRRQAAVVDAGGTSAVVCRTRARASTRSPSPRSTPRRRARRRPPAITIDELSKPRKVDDVQGKKGGKLTAGAKWKAPADAGGFAITKYKVAVFKKNGKKVDTKVVKADKLKFLFKLKPGKYFFKVRARNTDRWGPWSKPTDLVRPR